MKASKVYSVRGWNELYENNRTRDLKQMAWVPVPNRHDGDGYTTLVDRPNGAAMLGCWLAILQVASKCDPRGTLLREGAVPHDAASISRITRLPKELIQEAFTILENECKWLISSIPQEGAAKPQEGAPKPHPTDYGMEGNGTEQKEERERTEGARSPQSFAESPSWEEFWTYCQSLHCGLPAEWYAKDKWEAGNQRGWDKVGEWRAYARRCRGWWQQDGGNMKPPLPKNAKPAEKPILLKDAERDAKLIDTL